MIETADAQRIESGGQSGQTADAPAGESGAKREQSQALVMIPRGFVGREVRTWEPLFRGEVRPANDVSASRRASDRKARPGVASDHRNFGRTIERISPESQEKALRPMIARVCGREPEFRPRNRTHPIEFARKSSAADGRAHSRPMIATDAAPT